MDRIKIYLMRRFKLKQRVYRVFYNVFALLSFSAVILVHTRTQSFTLFHLGWFHYIFAFILMLCGVLIMALSIRKYFAEMSGLYKTTEPTLETAGMHQFVRHPLYLGTLIFALSLVLFWPEVKNFIAMLVLLFYTRIGIYLEENKLLHQFGEQYSKYQISVPMIIPRLDRFKK